MPVWPDASSRRCFRQPVIWQKGREGNLSKYSECQIRRRDLREKCSGTSVVGAQCADAVPALRSSDFKFERSNMKLFSKNIVCEHGSQSPYGWYGHSIIMNVLHEKADSTSLFENTVFTGLETHSKVLRTIPDCPRGAQNRLGDNIEPQNELSIVFLYLSLCKHNFPIRIPYTFPKLQRYSRFFSDGFQKKVVRHRKISRASSFR